jgi:hypothetical protein
LQVCGIVGREDEQTDHVRDALADLTFQRTDLSANEDASAGSAAPHAAARTGGK